MSIKTGFDKLDASLGGGIPIKTNVLISGGPGTGKTLFTLRFLLEGLRKGDKCCYVSLNENKDELLRATENIDDLKDMKKFIGKNYAIEHITLGENMTMKKFNEIIARYPNIDRLVIDNVNKLLLFTENPKSYRIHLMELLKHLKSISKCSLLICETKDDEIDTGNNESFECDGVFNLSFLDFEEKPLRILKVHKLRYSSFEPKIPYEFVMSNKGLEITDIKII